MNNKLLASKLGWVYVPLAGAWKRPSGEFVVDPHFDKNPGLSMGLIQTLPVSHSIIIIHLPEEIGGGLQALIKPPVGDYVGIGGGNTPTEAIAKAFEEYFNAD